MGRNPRRRWGYLSSFSADRGLMFPVGSLVEVRSADIGFRGAWFEATVTEIVSKRRRYNVSYSSLVADESSQKPLKETMLRSSVRPRPPPPDPTAVFGLHQFVEAFHNEGWWKGVVSKLPEVGGECLYTVCFPTSREEFRFKASEMRRRLEWKKGNWVPVEDDQDGVHVMFGEGTQVEVSCDRENYGVAWFVGTVLKVIGKMNFLVEYEYPRVGDNGMELLLKEIVDMQYIRPCPLTLEFTSFNVLDEVEGFHQNGWFAGVVSVVLPGPRYVVKHTHKEEEMVLDHTSLRPRCVWDNGHWVHISRDQPCKTETPRRTKLAIHRRKSSASKISDHLISLVTSSDDDGDVADRSSFSALKRKMADGPSQEGLVESSQASKKSTKGKSVEENLQLGNGMIRDKSGTLSIPVPSFKNNNGEIADGSDAANLKGKEAMGPSLECGVELSQPGKTLKKDNLLGEHSLLVVETKPVSKRQRSHSSKRSSIPSPVLTSSNTDGEVADILGAANLKDRKVVEPNMEDKSSHPSKKLDKGKSLEEHLKSVAGTLRDCGYKTRETVGKCSTAAKKLMLDRSPAFVVVQHHLRGSCESISPKSKMGPKSQSTPLLKELCHGQDTSGVNGSNKSIITGNESSCLSGEGCEHQSKEASFVNSPVGNCNFVPTADWENGKGDSSPTENTKMRRKKVVSMTPKRQGMTPDIVEEMKEHKGGMPSKKIFFMNSMKSKELEKETELVVGGEDEREFELFNQMPTLDVSDSSQLVDHQFKALDIKTSLLTITSEEKPPGNDGISLSNKQADIMENAHVMPLIESSILNAELLKCSVVQKSQILKSFLSRSEGIWSYARKHAKAGAGVRLQALPSMEDGDHDHDECILPGSPADKGVEIVGALIDPVPTGSSPPHEDNVFNENEFSPSNGLDENGRERENQALSVRFKENIASECDEFSLTTSGRDIFKGGEMALVSPSSMELSSEKSVFTKKSELWELVESIEVFHMLPQQPHFRPLLHYGKRYREGMALGLMVTFANLMTDISSLHIVDSQLDFEEKMKALGTLEANGFNIQPVRTRLENLLGLRSVRSQFEGKKHSLETEVLELEEEREQNCLLMFSVENAISELKQKLTNLQDKRESMLLDIRKNDSKLRNLKTSFQAAEKAIISVERQFNCALAAPW